MSDIPYNIIPSSYMFYRNRFVHRQRQYHYTQTQHLKHRVILASLHPIQEFSLTIDNGFDGVVEDVFLSCLPAKDFIECICLLYVFPLRWVNKWNISRHKKDVEELTLSLTEVPSSSMSMMGWPPSLISSLFCGRKRQTTLMLFPDIYSYDEENTLCQNRQA